MVIPLGVDVPMKRVPWANWAIIAVTSLVSIAVLEKMYPIDKYLDQESPTSRAPTSTPGPLSSEEKARFQRVLDELNQEHVPPLALNPENFSIAQLFTCTLVHADLLHLAGNMLFLFVFGNAVNAKLGHLAFFLYYLVAGVVASCAWLVLGNGGPALGASGAIMGIVGAFLIFYPRNDVHLFHLNAWTPQASLFNFSISSWMLIVAYLVLDLLGTIGGRGEVAYVAHLGGAVTGICLAVLWLGCGWSKADRGEETLLQILGLQRKRSYR